MCWFLCEKDESYPPPPFVRTPVSTHTAVGSVCNFWNRVLLSPFINTRLLLSEQYEVFCLSNFGTSVLFSQEGFVPSRCECEVRG